MSVVSDISQTEIACGPPPAWLVARRRRSLFLLGLAAAGVGFSMTLQQGLNSNFVGQTLELTGGQQGILEAFRESCGVWALFILATLAGWAEPLIGAVMLALLGIGLSAYAYVPTFTWLILASLVWSQGLHVWMPLPGSMTMALAEPGQVGRRMGQIGAATAGGSLAGLVAALVLHELGITIRSLWLVAGAAAVVAAGACLAIPRVRQPRQRIVVRRKYGLYYLLQFLEGWRKQIFVAFAGYMLVTQYRTPLSTMLGLFIATQIIGYFAAPMVGRLIDRVGERRVLIAYYLGLMPVFAGYGFLSHRGILYVLFVLDSALFTLAMAMTTYVSRIAPRSDHTATLSLGVAINHVAAVSMPLAGGLLWTYAGSTYTFLLGCTALAVSATVATFIPMPDAPSETV